MNVADPSRWEDSRVPQVVAIDGDFPGQRLQKMWETEPGFKGWLGSVDHKQIGIRYIVTAFAFLLLGGLEALVMRVQLGGPGQTVLTPQEYNVLFSMHGISMIFLYASPILTGFSNYLWPLILGSRDMAFPRLNALSYWIYLAAGLFIYAGFVTGHGPSDGWFNYVPYALMDYSPGLNMDVYALGMILLGISTTVGAANFIVTFLRNRAPGMSLNRVPVLLWGTLTASAANIMAVPSVSLAFFMLWMDRQFGTHFYDAKLGQPLLWQHLFWMFAHPWVYAIVLPAMGMVSDGLPTFCRRPLVGYTLVVLATVSTMAFGFGVWVHHMFATGLPNLPLSFFSGASFIITIPSGVAVLCWTATIWTGRPVVTTAFLFFASMIILFVIGGVSGVVTAAVASDWQLTDTYFIVAHLHYTLIGINLFPVIGAVYYWFPKMTGRLLNERLGKWNFWVMFIGFNVGFLPMHTLGLLGMPRRIYTYPADMGWSVQNLVVSLGSAMFAIGVLLFLINVAVSLKRGKEAGPNPWGAGTLEWATSSPPPVYNFSVIPIVATRHPLWEEAMNESTERSSINRGFLLDQGKETIGTSPLDGQPNLILEMPGDSLAPFALTVGMTLMFSGALLRQWWLFAVGIATIFISLVDWFWPRRVHAGLEKVDG